MTTRESKRLKTNDEAPYELIYHPGIPGRGEFIRLAFEEAGVAYTDHSKDPEKASSLISEQTSPENVGDEHNPPTFAPPSLRHGDLLIHQTSNILLYVAPKIGLAPKEGNAIYHLNQIVLTLLDGLVNELHDTHHPIAVMWYYDDQKAEAKKRATYFLDDRLPKYLRYVQRLLDAKTSGSGPWLYGNELTYADLVLFQVCLCCINVTSENADKMCDKNRSWMGPSLLFQRRQRSWKSQATMMASLSCTRLSRNDPTSRRIWKVSGVQLTLMVFTDTILSWKRSRFS